MSIPQRKEGEAKAVATEKAAKKSNNTRTAQRKTYGLGWDWGEDRRRVGRIELKIFGDAKRRDHEE